MRAGALGEAARGVPAVRPGVRRPLGRDGEEARVRPLGVGVRDVVLANTPAATQANSMARCRASVCAAHGARGCEGEEVAEENAPRAAASLGATRADFSPGFAADDAACGDADEDYAAARAYARRTTRAVARRLLRREFGRVRVRGRSARRARPIARGGLRRRDGPVRGGRVRGGVRRRGRVRLRRAYAAAYGDYRGAATRSNANANANANARLGFPGRRGTARAMARPAPFAPRRAGPGARGGVARGGGWFLPLARRGRAGAGRGRGRCLGAGPGTFERRRRRRRRRRVPVRRRRRGRV